MDKESLKLLLGQGLSVAEIGKRFGKDPSTVTYWMPRHREEVRAAKAMGLVAVTKLCVHHGETEFCLEGRGYYRCKRCRSDAVARRRRKVKAILVEEAGGACCICGYNRHVGALEFHHLDPDAKRLGLAAQGVSRALDTLRSEARKCVLLCSNCHVEVEAGVASLPIQ
jgi:DNA-directed RNA polymerase specialized sigma24 family protein